MPSTRRGVLASAGVGAVALAGCTTVSRSRLGDYLREPPDRRVPADWRPGPGTWAGAGYGPANTRRNPHATPPRGPPEVAWRDDLPEAPDSLVVAGGTVYRSVAGRLVAHDAGTGEVRWGREVGAAHALAYVDGRLYATTTDEELTALSPDGAELWRTRFAAGRLTALHEQDGYVFLGTTDGYRVLHADTGDVVRANEAAWEFLAAAAGRVYATRGSAPGTPVAYDVTGRTLAADWRVGSPCGIHRPVVDDGRVYLPVDPDHAPDCGGSHRLWAYDTDGERRWTATVGGDPGYLAADGDRVFVPTASGDGGSGRLVCLGRDGRRRWSHDVPGGLRAPTVAGGTVYAGRAGSDRAPLVALDAATGERRWAREVSRDVRIAAAGETLYVGAEDGLLALRD